METTLLAEKIRESIYLMIRESGKGHAGASLSIADILAVLYGSVMRYDPVTPEWDERDRFVLSKGHAGMAVYAALAHSGFFPVEELDHFAEMGSPLMNHPDAKRIRGVEFSTGSLGHGLSIATGKAYAAKMQHASWRVYSIVGDAECHEGQIWEAAMFAAHNRLGNLTCFVDNNGLGNDDYLSNTVMVEPLAEKWESFGWACRTVNGHDHEDLKQACEELAAVSDRPGCIIANTVKGKGLAVQGTPQSHYITPKELEYV